MVEQLHAKGYLKDDRVHKGPGAGDQRPTAPAEAESANVNSRGITHMIEELTRLKKLLEELEEPLDRFDEKLFTEIVQAIGISRRDENDSHPLIGGLRFTLCSDREEPRHEEDTLYPIRLHHEMEGQSSHRMKLRSSARYSSAPTSTAHPSKVLPSC